MNTATKVTGFTVGVIAVFGCAAGVGAVVGPFDDTPAESAAGHDMGGGSGEGHGGGTHDSEPTAAEEVPGGLMVSQNGYTLDIEKPELSGAGDTTVQFSILGPDGEAVTEYTEEHGKKLHLIVVRRDLTGYRHVHPTLDHEGVWTVPLDLSVAGEYRVFADFAPAGVEAMTLGTDLSVSGAYTPEPLPSPERSVRVGDYVVTLDGTLIPGEQSKLTLSVSKDGRPVTDLQPYLEAYGHLVALRDGDLAYLHVHPDGSPDDGSTEPGPEITFYATTPTVGDYRLFLDFRHGGVVRTAEFTAAAGDTGAHADTETGADTKGDHAHGH